MNFFPVLQEQPVLRQCDGRQHISQANHQIRTVIREYFHNKRIGYKKTGKKSVAVPVQLVSGHGFEQRTQQRRRNDQKNNKRN
ncbi:hypothetical protein SDC9_189084 [bioreactor metagenome]|uniref:Uncharacterized protein n=1 Tax=bioreactor metagenome TaxID=1076179 RepID=A0A645HST2_9ZZZZ